MGNNSLTAEILDQLLRAGLIEVREGRVIGKESLNSSILSLKFPVDIVSDPEMLSGVREFVAVDVLVEYQFEVEELNYEGIRTAVEIISKYVSGKETLSLYFSLLARILLARELLKGLGKHKMNEDELVQSFVKALPMTILIERGELCYRCYIRGVLKELLSLLKRRGYVEIKEGKVRKPKDVSV